MGVRIIEAGDAALIAELGDRIDLGLNARAVALAETLARERFDGVRDIVPTFCAVTVYFDPLGTDVARLATRLLALGAREVDETHATTRLSVDIPVCYGGEMGPDLAEVARLTNLTESEVVARHSAASYRVFMLGFVPGFAYLGVVDPRIVVPRRREPRTRVASGSVAIAGELTGIYPSETPGGWQVIGRTPLALFVPGRAHPSLVRAGDTVRFHSVDPDAFEQARSADAGSR